VIVWSLGLSGCMKIYPSPELPDIAVGWMAENCEPGSADVVLTLTGVDDTAKRFEIVAPCTDGTARFADLARERYHLDGVLRGPSGEMLSFAEREIDLRDGYDGGADLFFGAENFYIAWTFAMDATCESLAADVVRLDFTSDKGFYSFTTSCDENPFSGSLPGGTFTVFARALSNDVTVATAPPTEVMNSNAGEVADLGTLVLTPCTDSCF
jgi:hypothetical protein